MAAEGKSFQLSNSLILFDLFELDAKSGQLRRNGLPLDLSPQALRILVMLAERRGELVARKEIKEALWPGQSYGDFDSRLNFAIKKLREALGDDAEKPRYVQTVRNSGYRFIAPVREPQPVSPVPHDQTSHSVRNRDGTLPATTRDISVARRRIEVLALVTVVIIIIAVAATTAALRQRGSSQSPFSEVRVHPALKGESGPRNRIRNSDPPEGYTADSHQGPRLRFTRPIRSHRFPILGYLGRDRPLVSGTNHPTEL